MNLNAIWSLFFVGSLVLFGALESSGQDADNAESVQANEASSNKASSSSKKKRKSKGANGKQTVEQDKEEADPLDDTSTSFDFSETLLEGKFKAPSGMVLKGRVQQSKSQMVQLRKNFRPDLQKSSAAVRSIRPRE